MNNLFLLEKKILSDEELDIIKNTIISKEDYVKSLGPDVYGGTSENSLSGRHTIFNWLSVEEINNILVPKLKDIFTELEWNFPVSVQCWANTFRSGEGIKIHKHRSFLSTSPPFFCANIFIAGDTKPGTTYFEGFTYINSPSITIENDPGKLMVFTSETFHGVEPNKSDETRISIALDFYPDQELDDLNRFYIFR
jgi:hypothetical protein